MSRSGYSDDCGGWESIMWRGAVASATRGKRGQQMLRDMLSALDAMSDKRLIREDLESNGEVCAIGCLGRARGIDMSKLDPEEPELVAKAFGIASALAQEIVYVNDEHGYHDETPEQRWTRMRQWVTEQINDQTKDDSLSKEN